MHLVVHGEDEVHPALAGPAGRVLALDRPALHAGEDGGRHARLGADAAHALGGPLHDVADRQALPPDPVLFARFGERPPVLPGKLRPALRAVALAHRADVVEMDAVDRVVAGDADHQVDDEVAVLGPVDVGAQRDGLSVLVEHGDVGPARLLEPLAEVPVAVRHAEPRMHLEPRRMRFFDQPAERIEALLGLAGERHQVALGEEAVAYEDVGDEHVEPRSGATIDQRVDPLGGGDVAGGDPDGAGLADRAFRAAGELVALLGDRELLRAHATVAAVERGGDAALFQTVGRLGRYGPLHRDLLGHSIGERGLHPAGRLAQRPPLGGERRLPIAGRDGQGHIDHRQNFPLGVFHGDPHPKRPARLPRRLDLGDRKRELREVGQREGQFARGLTLVEERRRLGHVDPLAIRAVDEEVVVAADADQATGRQRSVPGTEPCAGGRGGLLAGLGEIDLLVGVHGRHRFRLEAVQAPVLGAHPRREQDRRRLEHVVADLQRKGDLGCPFLRIGLAVDDLRGDPGVEELDDPAAVIRGPPLHATALHFQHGRVLGAGDDGHAHDKSHPQSCCLPHCVCLPDSRSFCEQRTATRRREPARWHRPGFPSAYDCAPTECIASRFDRWCA